MMMPNDNDWKKYKCWQFATCYSKAMWIHLPPQWYNDNSISCRWQQVVMHGSSWLGGSIFNLQYVIFYSNVSSHSTPWWWLKQQYKCNNLQHAIIQQCEFTPPHDDDDDDSISFRWQQVVMLGSSWWGVVWNSVQHCSKQKHVWEIEHRALVLWDGQLGLSNYIRLFNHEYQSFLFGVSFIQCYYTRKPKLSERLWYVGTRGPRILSHHSGYLIETG